MSDIYKRIKDRREELSLSQEELAKRMGYKSRSSINKIESGENDIPQSKIEAFAKALSTTAAYLMGWDENAASSQRPIPSGFELMPNLVMKPLIGDIACGEPILAIENVDDYIMVPDNIHCDFVLRCKGDSMINARIMDGDLVMIRQQDDVENGEIAAVRIDGDVTLKRVYKYPGMVRLMPENPTFQPLDYNNGNCSEFSIVGKAVAFISTVR